MRLLIHLAFFTSLRQMLTSGDQVECGIDVVRWYFKKLPVMCIYGIKFTDGFDNELYNNDPRNGQIADHLDRVGVDLCKLSAVSTKDIFQEVVVPVNDGFIDLFITCCRDCDYHSEIDVRISLKSQFLRHRYAIIEIFQENVNYEVMKRSHIYNAPMTCMTEDYRERPATGNNAVCFTYGEEEFVNTRAGERYPSKLKSLLKMGQYNATAAKHPLGQHCKMHYANLSTSAESCSFSLLRQGYKYFCCCYDSTAVECQRLAATFLRKDYLGIKGLFCASHQITFQEAKTNEEAINFEINTTAVANAGNQKKNEYCYMRIAQKNITLGTNESLCEETDVLDFRLTPIVRTYCSSAKNYSNFCPFKISDVTENGDIVCCCNHQHFCNYNADINMKLASRSSDQKCFYNDHYQYLFNQYYVETTRNDVCLLHYVDLDTARDMSLNDTKTGLIFYSYPGNGFYPIDFSYTFLQSNTCAYVEVEIEETSIDRSTNCFSEFFDTTLIPVKIFACSCSLQENGNHCDQKLESEIANRAKEFPNELLTKCAQFDLTQAPANESDLIYVRHTSYCFTEVFIATDRAEGLRVKVRGNALTRSLAEQSGKHFDHIAFSMYNLSGSLCFCRFYDHNESACNAYPNMILTATRVLMQDRSDDTLRQLIRHPLNGVAKLFCQFGPFYASIFIDYRTSSFMRGTKCVAREIELLKIEGTHRPKAFDNSIFCDALPVLAKQIGCFHLKLWDEEVSENTQESNVICCCNKQHECDQTLYQIQGVLLHLKESVII